jgi:hypothetical protein
MHGTVFLRGDLCTAPGAVCFDVGGSLLALATLYKQYNLVLFSRGPVCAGILFLHHFPWRILFALGLSGHVLFYAVVAFSWAVLTCMAETSAGKKQKHPDKK